MSESLTKLCAQLGYRFTDSALLEAALTHSSAGSSNNERLEFLGDAALNFTIAAELYQRFASAREGELSRLRASLVKGETLAALARRMDLGSYLNLGQGELKSGGQSRDSTLADALEAIIGAVYLDGGIEICRKFILGLYRERLQSLLPAAQLKDPKTRLQEHLQSRKLPTPSYTVVTISGDAHAQSFVVKCEIECVTATQGVGSSRRRAEQDAADKAWAFIKHSTRYDIDHG